LLSKGLIDEAIEEGSVALELDPLSADNQAGFAYILYGARKYDEALKQCRKSLELHPKYPWLLGTLGSCYLQKSLFQQAIATFQEAVVLSGNATEFLSNLAHAYVLSGNLEKAHEILGELDMLSKSVYVSKYYLAHIQAAMGDKDKAFELLESAYKERDPQITDLKVDPGLDVLRSDPRYEMMLKKIGLQK